MELFPTREKLIPAWRSARRESSTIRVSIWTWAVVLARLAQARRTDRHRIAVRLLAAFDPQREIGRARILADHEHLARIDDLDVGDRGIRDRGAAHGARRHDHALRAGLHRDLGGRGGAPPTRDTRDRETGCGEHESPGVSHLGAQ